MDWKDTLGALLEAGSLPEESPATAESKEAPATTNKTKTFALNIVYEKKGRGGKAATIIEGFPEETEDEEISRLAGRLKSTLGIGGSARGGEILLQGDQRNARLKALLEKEGFRVKGIKA